MTDEASEATEVLRLWPDGPPSVIEGVGPEVAYSAPGGLETGRTLLRNISDPTLTVFTPPEDRRSGIGVIVVPGGGWTINAISHEGFDVGRWLAEAGHTAFVLKYRLMASPPDQEAFERRMARANETLASSVSAAKAHPLEIGELINTNEYREARAAAAEDGRRALELVRERAPRYSLGRDAIGFIGFSAGAFLSVDVALDPKGPGPAFVGAIYGGETRGVTVPREAPPLFTVVAQDDRLLVRIVEGLHADWSGEGRRSEHHVFPRGGHGFGMVRQGLPVDRWTELFLAWLDDVSSS